jgi:hypothetical protein
MENLKYLKNNLKYRVYWIKKDKNKIIIKDNSKSSSKNKLYKILGKVKKDREINLVRIMITFHSGIQRFQGGKVKINIKQFIYKNNKLSKANIIGENGNIWINNDFLMGNKINQKKMEEILLKIVEKLPKNKLKLLGINIISKYF